MSMTLILWKAPVVDDPDEAQKLLSALYETGDDSGFEATKRGRRQFVLSTLRAVPANWTCPLFSRP
jgi:hypothetical protein